MPRSLATVLAKGLTKRRDGCTLLGDVTAGAGWVTGAVGGGCWDGGGGAPCVCTGCSGAVDG